MSALLAIAAALVVLLIGCGLLLQRRRGARGRVRRGGLLVGAVALLLGCVTAHAPDASAGKPVHTPSPIGNINHFQAGDACPFTLQGELVGGNQVQTSFDNGQLHFTGRHIDRFTNMDTGNSTTLALQGSFDVVPTADGGSILQGSGIRCSCSCRATQDLERPRQAAPTSSPDYSRSILRSPCVGVHHSTTSFVASTLRWVCTTSVMSA